MTSTTIILGFIGVIASLPAWFIFLRGAAQLFGFVRAGQPLPAGSRTNRPAARLGRVITEVFGHTHFKGRPLVNIAHWLVMVGFMFGAVVWFEAYIQTFRPDAGWPWISETAAYKLAEEILAVGTVLGICFLIAVRVQAGTREKLSRFYNSNHLSARAIEAIVLIEGLGMLLVKAGKISTYHPAGWTDPVSGLVAQVLPASEVMVSFFALVKLMTGMVFLVLVGRNLSWGVAWHRFTSFFNIFFQRNANGEKALGALNPMVSGGKPLTMDNFEEDDTPGVGTVGDASWKMLLDSATCTECGRCQDLCPAWNTGKPLSPKKIMLDIKEAALHADLEADNSHAGVDVLSMAGVISDDVLWSCTNCGACVDQCPVDIEHIDHLSDLRRFRVLHDSDFPSELTGLFKNLETKGNPWGRNNSERRSWVEDARADGISVPIVGEDGTDFEYLFWVGCAGAYDDAGRATTRAVVDLLHTAGVKFAVLSTGETCTGDPARRAGNEFLFQMLAAENIETLNNAFDGVAAGQRKIITTCPHCFNTIRNEYPDFDGHFDVFHHTQLLNRLVRDGLLKPVPRGPENRKPITYHDPCFLGRHNKVYDPPRELLGATGMELREMDRSREEAFCCGAGGARMFQEEKIGRRVNEFRTEQALATGAEEIATGCPFCNVMMTGGAKALAEDSQPAAVRDVALMLRTAVADEDGNLPAPREKAFLGEPIRRTYSPTPAPEAADAQPAAKPQEASPAPAAEEPDSVAPAAPAAPAAPSAPAAPAAPVAPAAPAAPSTPPAPASVTPAAPSAPAAPAAPQAPAAPNVPSAPTAPAAPAAPAPAIPQAPAAPGAPAEKAKTPQAPESAVAPAPPAAPAAPATSAAETPKPPAVPAPPAAPSAPGADSPAVPNVPTAPAAPAAPAPAVPQAPVAPAPAEKAKTAQAPESAVAPDPPAAPAPPATSTAETPTAPAVPTASAAPQAPEAAAPVANVPSAPAAPAAPTPAAPPAPPAANSAEKAPEAPRPPAPPAAPGATGVPPAPGS